MSEQVILERPGITVTRARFVVSGQTYAMNGVTSVRGMEIKPSRRGPIICLVIGAIGIIAAASETRIPALWIGPVFWIGVGLLWWRAQKSIFKVILRMASGEVEALKSKEGALIADIVTAINQAIVARG